MSYKMLVIHFVTTLRADRPFKATVVYFSYTTLSTMIKGIYFNHTMGGGYDGAHTKWHSHVC